MQPHKPHGRKRKSPRTYATTGGRRLLANRNWVRGSWGYPAGLDRYGERLKRLPPQGCISPALASCCASCKPHVGWCSLGWSHHLPAGATFKSELKQFGTASPATARAREFIELLRATAERYEGAE